jgi:hypothetical protein
MNGSSGARRPEKHAWRVVAPTISLVLIFNPRSDRYSIGPGEDALAQLQIKNTPDYFIRIAHWMNGIWICLPYQVWSIENQSISLIGVRVLSDSWSASK